MGVNLKVTVSYDNQRRGWVQALLLNLWQRIELLDSHQVTASVHDGVMASAAEWTPA